MKRLDIKYLCPSISLTSLYAVAEIVNIAGLTVPAPE